ncbi:MAG: hypothetical protein COV59_04890 [Candidatus Magasanikbacteria bacterium CG11_big_fil_rev_8_21_14_0_20_39_34]|uniref:DUF4012 domain-containing protein n=1 Tax=Candidatus Magasanikbacteria bacterium CG11_big_fil_rev_8_21_14_0_20_39_34 TaxID=1974653 RepID=A0A2H0N3M7_9BACT|nr:MAG: hypothetical protein COV59_04890 [Candidatus Magasanikbacteria bacterium CG11_big_fil_rev_8_21_14_0_20_39_34]
MPKKRGRITRLCSVCRLSGHTKKTCKLEIQDTKKTTSLESVGDSNVWITPNTIPSSTKRHIFVCVHDRAETSPHVVNLRPKEEVCLKDVGVFTEKPVAQQKKLLVDFPRLVQNSQQRWAVSPGILSAYREDMAEKREQRDVPVIKKFLQKKEQESVALFPSDAEVDVLAKYRTLDQRPLVQNFQNRGERAISIEEDEYSLPVAIVHEDTPKENVTTYSQKEDDSSFIDRPRFQISRFFPKPVLRYAFAFIGLLCVLPFPVFGYYKKVKSDGKEVIEQSTSAFLSLQASTVAALQANIDKAQGDLVSALAAFSQAESLLEKDHKVLLFVSKLLPIIGPQVESRQHILIAGEHLALGNKYLVDGLDQINTNSELALTSKLVILREHMEASAVQYKTALESLEHVGSEALPVEYQQSFEEFKLLFATFVDDMNDFSDLIDATTTIFGHDDFRRYLIVFQNDHEIRPTGGFMGSFATVDVQKGKLLHVDVPGGGTYDVQGQLNENYKPPVPLQLINTKWEFQDANWFPDFPASAQKMQWFYRKTRGASTDGVIVLNSNLLSHILNVVGPITLDEYGVTFDGDNVLEKLQQYVEKDYDKEENKPKAIVGDLLEKIMDKVVHAGVVDMLQLLTQLHNGLENKDIQVYFNDPNIENKMGSFGWTGQIRQVPEDQDYLFVVNTNVGGSKSDAKIEQTIKHLVEVNENGEVTDTVIIHREHKGQIGEEFYGYDNIDYLRVYVPEGSQLIDAGGFQFPEESAFLAPEQGAQDDPDILSYEKDESIHVKTGTRVTHEFGKTVFANWMITPVGQVQEAYFTYKLPFSIRKRPIPMTNFEKWRNSLSGIEKTEALRYSLYAQKQSGVQSDYVFELLHPENVNLVWGSDDDLVDSGKSYHYEKKMQNDMMFGLVMQQDS